MRLKPSRMPRPCRRDRGSQPSRTQTNTRITSIGTVCQAATSMRDTGNISRGTGSLVISERFCDQRLGAAVEGLGEEVHDHHAGEEVHREVLHAGAAADHHLEQEVEHAEPDGGLEIAPQPPEHGALVAGLDGVAHQHPEQVAAAHDLAPARSPPGGASGSASSSSGVLPGRAWRGCSSCRGALDGRRRRPRSSGPGLEGLLPRLGRGDVAERLAVLPGQLAATRAGSVGGSRWCASSGRGSCSGSRS